MFNPLKATETIHNTYFDFFETSFSPNNPELAARLRELKDQGYIWRSPYISVSQPYVQGMNLHDFVRANSLSSDLTDGFSYIKRLYAHQENAIRNLLAGRSTVIASSTGSGKTEAFMIPILESLLVDNSKPGVKVIIVYPMNALANDQVERLRRILFGLNRGKSRKITFAIYTGNTEEIPQRISKIAEQCPEPGCGKNLFPEIAGDRSVLRCERNPSTLVDFQLLSRKEIRSNPPDILITNYVELEYLLLRRTDESLFSSNTLRFVVLDEIHSYTGAQGIDVAMLVRRLKRRVAPNARKQTIFVGTSATLSSKKDEVDRKKEVSEFASSVFGETLRESDIFEGRFEEWNFGKAARLASLQGIFPTPIDRLEDVDEATFGEICRRISGDQPTAKIPDRKMLAGKLLLNNVFFQTLLKTLIVPRDKEEVINQILNSPDLKSLVERFGQNQSELEDIVWDYMKLGSLSLHPYLSDQHNQVPLIRINFHNFFKTIDDLYLCHKCRTIYDSPMDSCKKCRSAVDRLGVCRFCGKEFFISLVDAEEFASLIKNPLSSEILSTIEESTRLPRLRKLSYADDAPGTIELWQTYANVERPSGASTSLSMIKCMTCGSLGNVGDDSCDFCDSKDLAPINVVARNRVQRNSQPTICPFCGNTYGRFSALSPITMSSNTASTTLFDIAYYALPEEARKMLIFTDNKQAASYLAGFLEVEHRTHTLRKLIYRKLALEYDGRFSFSEAKESVVGTIRDWYGGDFEEFRVREEDVIQDFNKEISSVAAAQRSLENLGLIEVTYDMLESPIRFQKDWLSYVEKLGAQQLACFSKLDKDVLRKYFISFLDVMRQDGAMRGLEKKRRFERDNAVGYALRRDNRAYWGIQIKNMTGRGGSIVELTEKSLDNADQAVVEEVVVKTYDYLMNRSLLVRARISKGKSVADANIVNSSKIIIRLPTGVRQCNRCRKIYANAPMDACLKFRCPGRTQEIAYDAHLRADRPNYYVKLYTTGEPARMVTGEDTGAIDANERRFIETEFKSDDPASRKIDVVVATPTLELGVDIGDLLSVGLFKSPPAPVNYVQRVGRAGRKDRISLNNAFMFLNPIDIYYYYRPAELIKGEITAPTLDIENPHMLRKHVNALIVEDLLVDSPIRDTISQEFRNFVNSGGPEILLREAETRQQIILGKIKDAFADITIKMTDQRVSAFIADFSDDLSRAVRVWQEELERYSSHAKTLSEEMAHKSRSEALQIDRQYERISSHIRALEHIHLLQQFMDSGLLPRYAFPGIYVNVEDEFGRETFGGQNRNYAISEYAPGTEATLRKQIYESVGVDLKYSKPKWTKFFVCPSCKVFVSESTRFDVCPLCHQRVECTEHESLAPETILLRRSRKPINEPRDYRQTVSDVFLKLQPPNGPAMTRTVDNFELRKVGNVEIIQLVSGIWHEEEPEPRRIELCNKCGRVRGELREDRHLELGGRDSCTGKFQPVNLYHSMPTNVISLKIIGQSLYGVPVQTMGDRFLVTLKNAVINAAQILTRADDGEIEGIVKGHDLYLYDNVEGGVGYVNKIFERFEEIMAQAADMVLNPIDECELGCVKCLYSYRRKRDIPRIDKSLIRATLEGARLHFAKNRLRDLGTTQKFRGGEITTVISPAFSLSGAIDLKNILESARAEIKLTSLYVTDDRIDWPDEGRRSWVDILSSIRQDRNKSVKITAIVRRPTSNDHRRALGRLVDAGVEVLIYEKELEDKLEEIVRTTLPGIVHSKLAVIDPQIPSTRYAIISSANFSPEMWKNHDTYNFGRDEEWVKGTYMAIGVLEKESRRIEPFDTMISEGILSRAVQPGAPSSELEDLGFRLAKASSEVWIMDPYLTREQQCFEYLIRWVSKGTRIRIITARVDSSKLKRELEQCRGKGYGIDVIRYFDRDKKAGQETILHDRYIIIDKKCVIGLGKGMNGIIEGQGRPSVDNVIIGIMENPSLVSVYTRNFQDFWNHENSPNDLIKKFPIEVY